jgi:hypothetical protein
MYILDNSLSQWVFHVRTSICTSYIYYHTHTYNRIVSSSSSSVEHESSPTVLSSAGLGMPGTHSWCRRRRLMFYTGRRRRYNAVVRVCMIYWLRFQNFLQKDMYILDNSLSQWVFHVRTSICPSCIYYHTHTYNRIVSSSSSSVEHESSPTVLSSVHSMV